MLGKQEEIVDLKIRNFFTWRFSWAWTNSRDEPHHWQWLDNTPQNYGWDIDPRIPEEIPVAVAGHPNSNIGKSFHQGRQPVLRTGEITTNTNQGLYFQEQWQRALQVDPQLVFVTGWNEWIAQRFVAASTGEATFMGKSVLAGQSYFIDLYNREYNRDIEPMKDGYSDTYYYQLVANIRRFKGMNKPEQASPFKSIIVDGNLNEWVTVKPVFLDSREDISHRNYDRFDGKGHYVNNTGRNDIVESRVSYNFNTLYFMALTNQPLSSPIGKNWMLLYIDVDQSAKTGWQGYDYLINESIKDGRTSISHWNGKAYQKIAMGKIAYKGKCLEVSFPLKALNLESNHIKIDFHWTDNATHLNGIADFFVNGDSAPDRRFNYRYNN